MSFSKTLCKIVHKIKSIKFIARSIPVNPSGFADIYWQGGKLLRYISINTCNTVRQSDSIRRTSLWIFGDLRVYPVSQKDARWYSYFHERHSNV